MIIKAVTAVIIAVIHVVTIDAVKLLPTKFGAVPRQVTLLTIVKNKLDLSVKMVSLAVALVTIERSAQHAARVLVIISSQKVLSVMALNAVMVLLRQSHVYLALMV